MRSIRITLAALAMLGSGGAWAGASVSYVEPDKFVDLPFSPIDRERVLKDLSDHFAELGKLLPAGQELTVEVTDLDLAGRIDHTRRSGNEIRVLRGGADWPRMELRYSLVQDGKVLKSGDAKLADMTYMDHARMISSNESLRFEKQMVDEWFAKTFSVKVRGVRG